MRSVGGPQDSLPAAGRLLQAKLWSFPDGSIPIRLPARPVTVRLPAAIAFQQPDMMFTQLTAAAHVVNFDAFACLTGSSNNPVVNY